MDLEPNAVSKLQAWKWKHLEEIERRKAALASQLLAVAPQNLSAWLKGSGVIDSLVKHGGSSRQYQRGTKNVAADDYTDLDEFAQRFGGLRDAWRGVVDISISWEDHLFKITFTAV
ncbi:MAG: hypothetical protein Q7T01_01190 [bacterium]|nr:hypothetical protein [bacterium]